MSYAEHDVRLENGLTIVIASKGDEVVITANGRMAVLGLSEVELNGPSTQGTCLVLDTSSLKEKG